MVGKCSEMEVKCGYPVMELSNMDKVSGSRKQQLVVVGFKLSPNQQPLISALGCSVLCLTGSL